MELVELKSLLEQLMAEHVSNATYRIVVDLDADGGLVLDIETESERAMIAWAIIMDAATEMFGSGNIAKS